MPFQRGDARPFLLPFALAKSVNEDDMIAIDGSGDGYKASEETWNTDLATTRAAFVAAFAGCSSQWKDANVAVVGMGIAGRLKVDASGVRTLAVRAGAYKIGDFVGVAKQAGNLLENQIVEVVSTAAQAIGKVVGGNGTLAAGALVQVEILSTVIPAAK
jgi:hypothetical protein